MEETMCKRQCWSVWLVCSVALLVLDFRSLALPQKDTPPHRCYTCATSNKSEVCPPSEPYCGTQADTPSVQSYLVCVEPTEKVCSLKFDVKRKSYILLCVCTDDLCNVAFSTELKKELLNFAAKNLTQTYNTTIDLIDLFHNSSIYANVTKTDLYRALTSSNIVTTPPPPLIATTTRDSKKETNLAPRAEALKQEGTAPSDDDEDESEGSGSFEETKSQKRPVSAPAAPSSFLPANENHAASLLFNVILIVPLFLLYLVV